MKFVKTGSVQFCATKEMLPQGSQMLSHHHYSMWSYINSAGNWVRTTEEGERVCVYIQSTEGTVSFYQLVALCLIMFVLEGVLQ